MYISESSSSTGMPVEMAEANMASDIGAENAGRESDVERNMSNSEEQKRRSEGSKSAVPFYKLFSQADSRDILLMILGTVGAVGHGVCFPLISLLFGQVTDAFGQNTANSHRMVHMVSKVCLRFIYIGAGAGVASFFRKRWPSRLHINLVFFFMNNEVACWMGTGERQSARIRHLYLKAILRQDIAFFDNETSTGEIIGRVSGDTILIQEAMGEKVGKFIQQVSTFIAGFVLAFVKGWKLTVVMLSIIPLLVVAAGSMCILISTTASRGQLAYAKAGNTVEQTVTAIRTVASFNGERKAVVDYEKSLRSAYKAAVHQALASGLGLGSALLVVFCSYALALWYGSQLIIKDGYSGGSVMDVLFGVLIGGMSLSQASPCLGAFAAGQAAAYRMFEVIHRKPEIDVYDMKGLVLDNIEGEIELQDVYFRYPSRPDVEIFSGFSLQIPRGTTAALVGESGSGKSTVISLIERFYDPQAGELRIDGINIKQFQLKWLRQQIALVSQEPVLFGTNIKENIAYGKDGATMEEIKAAAEFANAAKFISKMPQGFGTVVGEHGTQLSGGQKQRVAIARAVLKNPRILLLDEATSALDAESERVVQEALDRVMMNRTTVVVAHRLSTIRNADFIAVVQHGSIVEKGTHSQLIMNPAGAYSQLIHLQAIRQEGDHSAEDPHELEMHQDDFKTAGKDVSRRLSHSVSRSGESSFGSSRRSFSLAYTLPGTSSVLEDIQPDGSRQKKNLMKSLWLKHEGDVEAVEHNLDNGVSIFQLASLNKPEAPVLFFGSIAAAVNGLTFPVFGILLSSVITAFYEPKHKLQKDADFWALMYVLFAAISFIVAPSQAYCFAVAGARLVRRIRLMTFEKVVHQEIGWFDESENSSGAISARLSTDAAAVRATVGDALALVVQNIATVIAGNVIAFTANWQMALLMLALVPVLAAFGWIQMQFFEGFSGDAKVMYEEASQIASDAAGNIRTVASFCAEEKVISAYTEKCRVPLKSEVRQGIISGVGLGFSNFTLFATYAISFWVGSHLVKDGKTSFKKVFRVFFALTMSALGLVQATGLAPDISKVKASVTSVFRILSRKSKIDPTDTSGLTLTNVKGDIEFQHVSFKYPTRPRVHIFRDLCLFVHSGKTVALVGESGSGKSTVISLLERFYDPDSGHIFLDGHEIQKLQVKWLRQQMGLVSQEPILFDDTIRGNIAYGKEGIISDEQIIAAAEVSNAHKFITGLPQGYDTRVGERGVQLSGGQKQRVAIARAILRDPRILLLDEATNALDAESESIVQEALDRIMVNRTTIVVAHRLSTIQNADLIAVVKNGVIVEVGQHEELTRNRDGAYASLVKLHMASS